MRRVWPVGTPVLVLAIIATLWSGLGSALAQSPPAAESSPPGTISHRTVIIIQLHGEDGGPLVPADLAIAEQVVTDRLAALPDAAAEVRAVPEDRLRIEVGDPTRIDAARRVAVAPGHLAFLPVPSSVFDEVVEGAPFPQGIAVVPIVTNDEVAHIALGSDMMGGPALDIQLTPDGASAFDRHAAAHLGERVAIVLDGIVLAAPILNSPRYDGRAQVSGSFDEGQIRELMAILSGGVLPVPAEVLVLCPAIGECPPPSLAPDASELDC